MSAAFAVACAILRRRCQPRCCTTYPEDFDREYYPALKKQYASHPDVHIRSKEDYTIDPNATPWLEENRGRSLTDLRKAKAERAVHDGELKRDDDRPFLHSDLHEEEELAGITDRLKKADFVSGRAWLDPMPESDLELDENWIDFRKWGHVDDGSDLQFAYPKPLDRRIEEDEEAAVRRSADELCLELEGDPVMAWGGEAVDVGRWSEEAEKRGGNGTIGESYFLSPVTKDRREGQVGEVPDQGEGLSKHEGKWKGVMVVVGDEIRRESVWSEVVGQEWMTSLEGENELTSQVEMTQGRYRETLVPGRAVDMHGSYIYTKEFSLGRGFVKRLCGAEAVVELCILQDKRRDRVILCGRDEQWTHIVFITESRDDDLMLPTSDVHNICGEWYGKGVILHPEYPPLSAISIDSKWHMRAVSSIVDNDVTWTEAEPASAEESEHVKPQRRRRVSKRVRAARRHDCKRLAECSYLCTEQMHEDHVETHAWRVVDAYRMRSPRVGKFVEDYGAIMLHDLFLTYPDNNKCNRQTVISLMHTHQRRTRLTAVRSTEGSLVGAMFSTEQEIDTTESDSVSLYV